MIPLNPRELQTPVKVLHSPYEKAAGLISDGQHVQEKFMSVILYVFWHRSLAKHRHRHGNYQPQ